MKFHFSGSNSTTCSTVNAKNLEQAKEIFKATELFPEQYVAKECVAESEYDSTLGRNIYKVLPNAYIVISDDEWNEVGKLYLSECDSYDYRKLNSASQRLITDQTETDSSETLPIVGNRSALQKLDKIALRERHDLIKRKMYELEETKRELQLAKDALMNELKHKKRLIYMIETFLGSNEQINTLIEGTNAPEEDPLYIYQEKLYMDEEMGIWSNGGLDFKDLDKFDEWIAEHYATYLYKAKSICAFQIRRHDKDYSSNFLENIILNEENKKTYFLIRNGDNLYRLWSDIHIGEKLFPTKEEYKKVLEKASYWNRPVQEEALSWMDFYMFSLLSIQGIIERTTILGTSLKGMVNLCKPEGMPPEKVVLIRDAEPEFWIGDGRPSWSNYVSKNRESIKVGTRIALTKNSWEYNRHDNNPKWRTEPFNASPPQVGGIHIVEEVGEERSYHGWKYLIRYLPDDTIWSSFDGHKRKRRVPFRLYGDEVLNVDEITFDEIEYYLHNRLYRKDYLRILPVLYAIKDEKIKEVEYEEELVKLLAGSLGWDVEQYQKIRDAIHWWKLKNKWKRAVTKDESKAVRMIIKKLKVTK